MRPIKFRAWDGARMLDSHDGFHEGVDVLSQVFECMRETGYTLMQFTGLLDRNGVEIYEGDFISDGFGSLYVVEFSYGCFGHRKVAEQRVIDHGAPQGTQTWKWVMDAGDFSSFHKHVGPWKVVGNIYENPELLK